MGLINWIFDIYQHQKIEDARTEASAARAEIAAYRNSSGGSSADLERPMGELALAAKTMQRMMVEKGICSSQEFYALLHQVDMEDGRADGRAPI